MTPNWPVPVGRAGSRRIATWVTSGAICLSNSSHFALVLYSKFRKPVTLPPGRASVFTKPAPTGSPTTGKDDGHGTGCLQKRAYRTCTVRQDHIGFKCEQLGSVLARIVGIV